MSVMQLRQWFQDSGIYIGVSCLVCIALSTSCCHAQRGEKALTGVYLLVLPNREDKTDPLDEARSGIVAITRLSLNESGAAVMTAEGPDHTSLRYVGKWRRDHETVLIEFQSGANPGSQSFQPINETLRLGVFGDGRNLVLIVQGGKLGIDARAHFARQREGNRRGRRAE